METTPIKISAFADLVTAISQANQFFLNQVQRQVNTALTLRNWVIGCYIFEYEQHGKDRAVYGQKLYKIIAGNLKEKGLQSLGDRTLYLCKDFYIAYPHILQAVSARTHLSDFQDLIILQALSAKLATSKKRRPMTSLCVTMLIYCLIS
jgi:hypothetical protein